MHHARRAQIRWPAIVLCLALVCLSTSAYAGGGPLGIDHRWSYDNSGIWSRSVQTTLEYGLIAAEVAGAVYEGGETRLGRTYWQAIDASASSAVVAQALKLAFSRVRPADNNDPNLWFKGHGNQSFPSGEVTEVSSIVTPFVLEYGSEHPAVYALELLPVYDAIARMKVQAHWQTDVIAGLAIGTATGWLMHRNPNSPYVIRIMPHGIYVGIRTH
jgi:acid phosphatase family membrane protein YuiD